MYCVEVYCKEREDDETLHFTFNFTNEDERAAFLLCLNTRMRVKRQYSLNETSARDASRIVYSALFAAFD